MLMGFGCSVARHHGRQNYGKRKGPPPDHNADTLYELQREAARLRADIRRLFREIYAGIAVSPSMSSAWPW